MEDPKIDQFLFSNGFDSYVPLFRNHAIRSDVLLDLTSEDLLDMGISSLGHRIQLLKLIDGMRPLNSRMHSLTQRTPLSASSWITPGSESATSFPHPTGPSSTSSFGASRENLLLKQRIEVSEKHIRKLSEQVARLRADLFRKFKESEPLPTPSGRTQSPASTPGTGPGPNSSMLTKRSPSDGYFSRTSVFPGSAIPSPGGMRSSSNNVHVFHGHYQPGTSAPTSSHISISPSAYNSSSHSVAHSTATSPGNANLVITAPSEPFKNFRCGEKDNVAKVLGALFQRKYLEGDISQWRLQIEYGDKARELLDHEHPLLVFKQLQDQGHKPLFTMKPAQPHKPPAGGSYI